VRARYAEVQRQVIAIDCEMTDLPFPVREAFHKGLKLCENGQEGENNTTTEMVRSEAPSEPLVRANERALSKPLIQRFHPVDHRLSNGCGKGTQEFKREGGAVGNTAL